MEQNSEHVYYIADENKLSVVDENTHISFVDFILEKTNRWDVAIDSEEFKLLVNAIYNDIIYLGEL